MQNYIQGLCTEKNELKIYEENFMVKIRVKGRLGNQLFIYAFARMISEMTGEDILIYDRKDEKDEMWYSHLDFYKLCDKVNFTSSKKEIMKMSLIQKIMFLIDRIYASQNTYKRTKEFEDKYRKLYLKNHLLICENGYFEIPENLPKDLFCIGYFQSPKFFEPIREQLLVELQPKQDVLERNKEFIKRMDITESVCITIRLGDFVNNPMHQVCTIDYFKKAIEKMKELKPNSKFFVFSDDIETVKKTFDFGNDVEYDEGINPDYESLRCMSHCKHFIISNSTFSWWAEYLSTNPDKIVIAPSKWYANPTMVCDIEQDYWIRL